MENETPVTMVRLYIPQASHSTRRAQMEKVLHLLRDQLHVHGVTIVPGMKETEDSEQPRYDNVGDLLRRNPDPPLTVEFLTNHQQQPQLSGWFEKWCPAAMRYVGKPSGTKPLSTETM